MLSTGVFPVSIYGQDNINFSIGKIPYRISLAAGAGVLLGQAEEIVYNTWDFGTDTDIYGSQLLWDLKPLVYLGSSLSLSRANPLAGLGAAADLSVKFGLPILSGTMEDRDWQNSDDPGMLTDFSSHDAYILGGKQVAILLDFSGGITIPIKSVVALKALFSFSYMHFSWNGQDGYGEYMKTPYPQEEWRKETFHGTVITYDQNWLILSPGLGVSWPVHRVLDLDFRFFISPLIYAGALDTHYYPTGDKTEFKDTMLWGLYLEPGLDLSFSPNQYLSLIAHGSWRFIRGTRGYTVSTDTNASGIRQSP
jgi:outer membrane protease